MRHRQGNFDQSHQIAETNAVKAVRDAIQIVSRTEDPLEVKERRALEILRNLWKERSTDLDRAFIYEDAEKLLLDPP